VRYIQEEIVTRLAERSSITVSLPEWSLTVGEIVAPFGRLGEVKVRLETDFPDRFSRLKRVCLRWPSGAAKLVDVQGTRLHKGQILLKVLGIESIDDAETLRNALVQIHPDDAVRLPDNEYYIHDLVGSEVVTSQGSVLGRLTSVLSSPANDVYVIGEGKSEILLPAIRDVVLEVDVARKRIVVNPTPGLLPEEQTTQNAGNDDP
jgi:16S rRNA processing protein RimM